MALQLDWTDTGTDVTYDDAYAVIHKLTYSKGVNNNYSVSASIKIYKNATAFSDGKKCVGTTTYASTVSIQSNDTAQTYRNVINQVYNDMKQNDPWDDATDV